MRSLVCTTGQHSSLLRTALADVGLTPDFRFAVGRPGQDLAALLERSRRAVAGALASARPDAVLVQGDTTSALAGALAAVERGIPVGHVEAGLRTSRADYPFPEELNRRLIGRLARFHFAPTRGAAANLRSEGIDGDVVVTGNPVVDGVRAATGIAPPAACGILRRLAHRQIALVTCHRRENWGDYLLRLAGMLGEEVARDGRIGLVWPVHANPEVRTRVRAALAHRPGAILCPPLPHGVFLYVLRHAAVVVTDSGGVLEEAVTLGRPVIVLRPETERPEATARAGVRLVGQDLALTRDTLRAWLAAAPRVSPTTVLGDGRAGERIADALLGALPRGAR